PPHRRRPRSDRFRLSTLSSQPITLSVMSVINTNIQAITAARNLNRSQEMLGRSLNRLSSGSKIVNPSDDAAGLAVSEKLDAQSMRVKAASTNVQNAISYI